MSFWIYSPRSLSNLLAEPDMPSLDMYAELEGGITVYLNNNQIASMEITGKEENKIPNIMLDKGWNHMIIKLVNPKNNFQIKSNIRFDSADKNFMKQVLSSVVR